MSEPSTRKRATSTAPPVKTLVGRKLPKGFGVYIRSNSLWHLEHVTNREAAELAKEVNEALGLEVLIAGPWTYFPKCLEA